MIYFFLNYAHHFKTWTSDKLCALLLWTLRLLGHKDNFPNHREVSTGDFSETSYQCHTERALEVSALNGGTNYRNRSRDHATQTSRCLE